MAHHKQMGNSFNPLKEKGIPLEKQLRSWKKITHKPYDKREVDAYTRTRQILINGIEIEGWMFNHMFSRMTDVDEMKQILALTRHIEDQQQTTIDWLVPADQTVLETTLAYEQVATELTAYLAQHEPDDYIRKAFDFGLLEDFDHLYRFCQLIDVLENRDPDTILQGRTDVFPGRPTQDHHNDARVRLRRHYDKSKASPQTKVNTLTLLSAEQQTHNFYKAHGMQYSNQLARQLYAEIADVEEEHVSQYESLIDPNETLLEKWLMHEFTEVCNYYTFMHQETDDRIKAIWEEFLAMEIEHLKMAASMLQKYEKRDAEEVIGSEAVMPSIFESQKEYVAKVLEEQVDLRLTPDKSYAKISDLPDDWASYRHQKIVNADGAPSEEAVRLSITQNGEDVVRASDTLKKKQADILKRGLDKAKAPDTVEADELVGAK